MVVVVVVVRELQAPFPSIRESRTGEGGRWGEWAGEGRLPLPPSGV